MSVPDGTFYWWGVRGYTPRERTPEQEALRAQRREASDERRAMRLADLCDCQHERGQHGRVGKSKSVDGQRHRNAGRCNQDCTCTAFHREDETSIRAEDLDV